MTTVTTNFNGGTYQVCWVNHSSYCLIHQTFQSEDPSTLMDSGANGSMAGYDTCLLSTVPHAHVDITGVGGTVMEPLPLIQCVSVVETLNEGKIILIMSQYAHKPDSKTIHSKSQIEHFGGTVYDSAQAAGGSQMVVTHEGYAIPLNVHNGLCYMDMQPASNSDLTTYPHVFFMANAPWNPDIVDKEFFFNSLDCLVDLPIIQQCHDGRDPHIDMYGEPSTLSLTLSESSLTQDHLDAAVEALVITSQTMKQRLPDLDTLMPFPAANVHRLPEWYATDTFISDVPAFDNGVPGHGGGGGGGGGANCYSSTVDWIPNCCLDSKSQLPASMISSVSMVLWLGSNLIMPNQKLPLP